MMDQKAQLGTIVLQVHGIHIAFGTATATTTVTATATATGSTNKNEQLLYMPSLVGGEGLQLLIDSGAMHNFALNALLENLHLPVIVVK